jgi:hypothetical protein
MIYMFEYDQQGKLYAKTLSFWYCSFLEQDLQATIRT